MHRVIVLVVVLGAVERRRGLHRRRDRLALHARRLGELGPEGPYGRAPRLQVAYLTDLFNDLIDQGGDVRAVEIAHPRSWREIDTVQDFQRAAEAVTW